MKIKSNTESNEKEKKFSQEAVYMWMILYDFLGRTVFMKLNEKKNND